MKKAFVAFTCIAVFICIFTAYPASAWEHYRIKCKNPQAQKLADQMFEMMKRELTPATYKKSVELMEKAVALEPDNHDLYIEIAANSWNYADRLPKETKEQKKIRLGWFDKGKAAAQKALDIKKSAASHFWYGVNLAAGGEMVSIIKSVWMFPHMVKSMKRSEELDPNYIYGGVSRFWSEVSTRVPNFILKMVGVSPTDALKAIQDQIKKRPYYFENYVFMARYLIRLKQKKEALDMLEYVLSHDPRGIKDPNYFSSNVEAQGDARALWKEYTGKNYPAR